MTTQTNSTATKPTAAQVWRVLEPVIFDQWTPPLTVRLHPDNIAVEIQLRPNDRRAVDKVIDFLGLPPGFLHTGYTWSPGEPDEMKVYGHFYSSPGSALLPHWGVTVYCGVYTRADASAHWDGLIMHASSVLAEVTA